MTKKKGGEPQSYYFYRMWYESSLIEQDGNYLPLLGLQGLLTFIKKLAEKQNPENFITPNVFHQNLKIWTHFSYSSESYSC